MSSDHINVDMKDMQHVLFNILKNKSNKNKTKPLKC